ncbi:hypothetical protein OEZ85_011093 [Tetradesmus obliquus]|uniref:Kazal-like domain-containing protein n=1 Tax=Tetradesmus obliquus TaxID=3088 RepID=A0ABY8TRB4_TETOB|nr:hypothetical protein OEZ85_011093 [Tetradesmus obliquus]
MGTIINAGCRSAGWRIQPQDVYGEYSPYLQPKDWECVLPSRHLPCKSLKYPGKSGITMWQSLGTIPCSAERDFLTNTYSTKGAGLAIASECDVCVDCGTECGETLAGPALGDEVCCFGAKQTQACSSCAGIAASPVCGVDGNTYGNACLAQCNGGAGVKSSGPCAGAPNDLDLFKAPTKDSASDIAALNTAGLVVLGAAKVGGDPNTAGGYATGLSVSSTASQRVALTAAMFQARYVAAGSASAGPLLAALPADKVSKVFRAFKALAKNAPAPDPAGPQRGPQQQQQKMMYPFTAMGLIVKATGAQPYKGFCTGFLVTNSSVLTAAHCVHDLKTGATPIQQSSGSCPR